MRRSDPLEVAAHLPVGDRSFRRRDLLSEMVPVVLDDIVAEEPSSIRTRNEAAVGFRQSGGNSGDVVG